MKSVYKITSDIKVYPGSGGWRFLVIKPAESKAIKASHGGLARGWGSLPVEVTIGKTTWETSIFPDNKTSTYLLPLKAKVRKVENIYDDDVVQFVMRLKSS